MSEKVRGPSWKLSLDTESRLHRAVQKNLRFKLQHLLASIPELDPTVQDDLGRTPLHYAVISPNHSVALKMVTILLECKQLNPDSVQIDASKQTETKTSVQKTLAKFINIQDKNGESAVHLAASKWRKDIVFILVTKCSADISLISNAGKSARQLIFANVPEIVGKILNTRIMYPRIQEVEQTCAALQLNFKDIIDTHQLKTGPTLFLSIETQALAKTFDRNFNKNQNVLTHPLIQTFLALKWNKMRIFTYFAMVLKMILLLLYNYFAHNFYVVNCPFQEDDAKEAPRTKRGSWSYDYEFDGYGGDAKLSPPSSGRATFLELNGCETGGFRILAFTLIAASMLMGVKEMYKMFRFKRFLNRLNVPFVANLLFIPAVVSTATPVLFRHSEVLAFYYQAAAIGVLISWTLFLVEMRNVQFGGIGKYVEIFGKVIKRFAKLLLIFLVLFIAFLLSFGMIMPKVSKFSFPSGILKSIVMMTGEVNYDELFYDKNKVPNAFQAMTQFWYMMFVLIVSIMLVNLLIGFTVSDVTELRQAALVNQLAKKLEHLHFLETLLFDIARNFRCFEPHYRKFLVIPPTTNQKQVRKNVSIETCLDMIPGRLQQDLRKLAFKNTDKFDDLKIPPTPGVTWVKAKNGFVPENAVQCDYLDYGEILYVTRVTHGKNVIPGKLRKNLRITYYPWEGAEYRSNKYEVLTVIPPASVSWQQCSSSQEIPKNAIIAGITEEAEVLYVGQGNIDNVCGIGRVDYSDRLLSIPFGGAERICEEYQILVKN